MYAAMTNLVVAALAFVASATTHVFAVRGLPSPIGDAAWLLQFGVALLLAQIWNRAVRARYFRGCSPLMLAGAGYLVFYAVATAVVVLLSGDVTLPRKPVSEATPADLAQFSAGWMALYWASATIAHADLRLAQEDEAERARRVGELVRRWSK